MDVNMGLLRIISIFLSLCLASERCAARPGGGRGGSRLSSRMLRPDTCSRALGRDGRQALAAASLEVAKSRSNLAPHQILSYHLGGNSSSAAPCEQEQPCRASLRVCRHALTYRTADGVCNNLRNTQWGAAHRSLRRYLPPAYADGISEPRVSASGGALPSARLVSTTIHETGESADPRHSTFLMQWGQFLDHDITLTPLSTKNDEEFHCCSVDAGHSDCFPISIPTTDPLHTKYGETCMEFARSEPTTTVPCQLGERQQINQITAYIDASNVYGSTLEDQTELRLFRGGKLRSQANTFDSEQKDLLPNESGNTCTNSLGNDAPCFRAGDIRASVQIGLTSLHTIWMREHNRLVSELSDINPHWNDERLFQEARRIVGAQMQHITYNEFLPLVLGPSVMEDNDLTITSSGYSRTYDATVDAGIANIFATAAFRFGHTLIPNVLSRVMAINSNNDKQIKLAQTFFQPQALNGTFPKGIDALVAGMCTRGGERADRRVVNQVRDHLFEEPGAGFGLDLAALNIQRGRDHGIRGYPSWRKFCGLSSVTDFADLENILTPGAREKFEQIYQHVNDIDLFSAGISEQLVPGGLVGETFACILARQFRDLRRGDRFWYENRHRGSRFSRGQLTELKKVKLSRVLCVNSDTITRIQPDAMLMATQPSNEATPCDSLPNIDLRKWREKRRETTGPTQGFTRPGTRPRGTRPGTRPRGTRPSTRPRATTKAPTRPRLTRKG